MKHCENCTHPNQCLLFSSCSEERAKSAETGPKVSTVHRIGAIGRKLDLADGPAPTEIPDNVVLLGGITRLPLPVSLILDGAKKRDLTSVIVIGTDADGDFFFSSSQPDGASVLWDLEIAKLKLLTITMPRDADAAD